MLKFITTLLVCCACLLTLLAFCTESYALSAPDCRAKVSELMLVKQAHEDSLGKQQQKLSMLLGSGLRKRFLKFRKFNNQYPQWKYDPKSEAIEKEMVAVENEIYKVTKKPWKVRINLDDIQDPSCRDSLDRIKAANKFYVDALKENNQFFKRVNQIEEKANGFVADLTPASISGTETVADHRRPEAKNGLTLNNGFNQSPDREKTYDYYIVDSEKEEVYLANFDDKNRPLESIARVRSYYTHYKLPPRLIMNGGMYDPSLRAKGLFISSGKAYKELDLSAGDPRRLQNFYLLPNGVYYIDEKGRGGVMETHLFSKNRKAKITMATQSGPMLLIDGEMHPAFNEGSPNVNIRNGVGILPDGRTVYAISNRPVNFYAFATFFMNMGCKNALYLDGVVSRMYEPTKRPEAGNNLGVFIVVTEKQ